jgi:hypothetical protein
VASGGGGSGGGKPVVLVPEGAVATEVVKFATHDGDEIPVHVSEEV